MLLMKLAIFISCVMSIFTHATSSTRLFNNDVNRTFAEQCILTMCPLPQTKPQTPYNLSTRTTPVTPPRKRSLLMRKRDEYKQKVWNYFLHKHDGHQGYVTHKANAMALDGPVADYNPSILESDSPSLLKVFSGVIKVKWPETHRYDYFRFKDYKKAFDDGILSLKQKREIIRLREQTVFRLIEYSVQITDDPMFMFDAGSDMWYEKIGSDSLSSDFDLTYARWDKPRMVVPAMMTFYNRAFQLYQGWPLSVWDLNMYITSAFITSAAYELLRKNQDLNQENQAKYGTTLDLFKEIKWTIGPIEKREQKSIWALAKFDRSTDPTYIDYNKADMWLAHWFIMQKGIAIELGQLGIGENDFEMEMLKFSEIFYYVVYQLQKGKLHLDVNLKGAPTKMYLKVLLYYMNFYSDETYISGPALQYMRDNALSQYDPGWRRIAMLDNFAFIAEYYVHAMADDNKNEKQQWFYFFDRSFKYIVRIGKLIQHFLLESPREESPIQNMRGQRGVRRSFRARLIELYEEHIGVEIPDAALKSIYGGEARTTEQFAALSWYTLARLWLEKNAEKKTIRGDIEKGDIILPNGEVSTKDVTGHPDEDLIVLGRRIWTAVQTKTGLLQHNPLTRTHVWESDTFYKKRGPEETTAPWTEVVQLLRQASERVLGKKIEGRIDKLDTDHLKNGVLQMMYNICGEEQFVTNVMHSDLLRNIHGTGMLKGVVKAYKKYEKKGQKLTIPSDEAYNYKYFNPYTTIKFKAQSKLGVAHGQMLRPEQEAERQFPGEDAANS
eukprot:848014_1